MKPAAVSVLIAVIFLIAFAVFRGRGDLEPTAVPDLFVSSKLLDFGNVGSKSAVAGDFVFVNRGSEEILLDGVKTDCGCALIEDPPTSILPSQRVEIRIRWRVSGSAKSGRASTRAVVSARLPRDGKDEFFLVPLKMVANPVLDSVGFAPSQLSFDVETDETSTFQTLVLIGPTQVVATLPKTVSLDPSNTATVIKCQYDGELTGSSSKTLRVLAPITYGESLKESKLVFEFAGALRQIIEVPVEFKRGSTISVSPNQLLLCVSDESPISQIVLRTASSRTRITLDSFDTELPIKWSCEKEATGSLTIKIQVDLDRFKEDRMVGDIRLGLSNPQVNKTVPVVLTKVQTSKLRD